MTAVSETTQKTETTGEPSPMDAAAAARWLRLLQRPWLLLLASLAVAVLLAAGLPGVMKDSSVDAFVPQDNPAALTRDRARAMFDVEDPVIVALVAEDSAGVFTPERLTTLVQLTDAIARIPGVTPGGVTSLATESAMRGEDGDLFVDPIIPDGPLTANDAANAWARTQSMAPYMGVLASQAGDAAMIIAQVDDPDHATEVYLAIAAAADAVSAPGLTAHVAGVAAMNGRLALMVDANTRIFIPVAALVVLVVVLAAVRRPIGLLGPLVVIGGSTAAAIGLMGWVDARYYLITTALPVIIMSIAVADCLHIVLCHQRERLRHPAMDARAAVAAALAATWRPVTLTSLTTIAGFAGLAIGSPMAPISEFGLFAGVGVAAAWALSLTALPAILILTDLKPARDVGRRFSNLVDAGVAHISDWAAARSGMALSVAGLGALACLGAASLVDYDYERKRYFLPDDPVREADAAINARFAGANMLDVVVRAEAPGGLMTSDAVAAMAALQSRLEQAPYVRKTTGIADYIALMHARLTDAPEGALPTRANAAAQYMFLYEASGDPDDFKEEIDYDYQTALIRAHLDRDSFAQTSDTIAAFQAIIEDWSAQTGLSAELSGRVAVNHGWMSALSDSHPVGLAYALVFVFIASAALFRDLRAAIAALAPTLTGVTVVYAVMGVFDIDIAPATSMCAAISTGLGVDFGIHLVDRIRRRLERGLSVREAVREGYIVVARACAFSALALGVGLSVVTLSTAPALQWFGLLIAAGALGALAGALLITPAAAAWLFTKRAPRGALTA